MKPLQEAVQEILKGLEGLQMLGQWELSLTRDLCAKTQALLKSVSEDPPAEPPPQEP